jgi:hypothetical protein
VKAIVAVALALAAIFVPLALAEWAPPFVGMSYGVRSLPFELLGLTGGAAIFGAGVVAWRRHAGHGLRAWVAAAAPLLLALHFLVLTSEYAERRFDYDCYEYAGRALLAGQNPYQVGLIYLYPPLTARAMAGAWTGVEALSGLLGWSTARDDVWDRVFYLYQCAQLALVVAAYFLLLQLARRLGLLEAWAPALVAGLLVFDVAVFRTLRHGQVNLWVLDLALCTLLFARRAPWLAGLALALAGHIKLYPLLLFLPLVLTRQWRALAWGTGGLAVIALGLADFGRSFTLWSWYLEFMRQDFPGEIAIRNTSWHAIFWNATHLLAGAPRAVGALAAAATVASGLWYLARAWLRERGATAKDAASVDLRLAYHGADALAFALLVSPSVWEHHYVMALPLALCAVALRGRARAGLVALGVFGMLGMPTFDLYPLSLHRLAGLLLLLALLPAARPPVASWVPRVAAPMKPA